MCWELHRKAQICIVIVKIAWESHRKAKYLDYIYEKNK